MFKSKSLMAVAAAALLGAGFAASQVMPSAEAQATAKAPVILVVDRAALIATSSAGQSVAQQMETLQTQANAELQPQADALRSSIAQLQSQSSTMAEDDLNNQGRELAAKRNEISAKREIAVRELSIAEQNAIGKISEAAAPILQEIVDQRGATLLLERNDVIFASRDSDITQEAIQKLNAKLTSVTVEQVDLEAEIQKARAAQAASQQGQ